MTAAPEPELSRDSTQGRSERGRVRGKAAERSKATVRPAGSSLVGLCGLRYCRSTAKNMALVQPKAVRLRSFLGDGCERRQPHTNQSHDTQTPSCDRS
jgi:hypothetical protein